jgi:hypothetical protein
VSRDSGRIEQAGLVAAAEHAADAGAMFAREDFVERLMGNEGLA